MVTAITFKALPTKPKKDVLPSSYSFYFLVSQVRNYVDFVLLRLSLFGAISKTVGTFWKFTSTAAVSSSALRSHAVWPSWRPTQGSWGSWWTLRKVWALGSSCPFPSERHSFNSTTPRILIFLLIYIHVRQRSSFKFYLLSILTAGSVEQPLLSFIKNIN